MSQTIESTLGLSRRLLNLVVGNGLPGVKSLCCIDLTHQSLFNPTTPTRAPNGNGSQSGGPQYYAIPQTPVAYTGNENNIQAGVANLMMEQFQLPSSSMTFRASASAPKDDQWKIDCFPLAGRKVICVDQLGRAFHFNAETGQAVIMPSLHKPKSIPLALFVPNADADNDYDPSCWSQGSSLFVMERFPKPEVGCRAQQHSDQFEAFVYHKPRSRAHIKSWHCKLLPPPPYVREPKYWEDGRCLEISSYAALGTSDICISINGVGTYRLHTDSQAWEEVGKWTLPFHGKAEYVPELKLWFGLSAESQHLAASDLSSLDSQPQLLGPWKELDLPEEWKECKDSQLVNLGSGKFCIARFFHPTIHKGQLGDELSDQNFTVLTGVEVVSRVQDANINANISGNSSNGITELQIIPHKSRYHSSIDTTIHAVF